jgi:hypothetical protein
MPLTAMPMTMAAASVGHTPRSRSAAHSAAVAATTAISTDTANSPASYVIRPGIRIAAMPM